MDELGPQLMANYQELDRNSYMSRFLMRTLAAAGQPVVRRRANARERDVRRSGAGGAACGTPEAGRAARQRHDALALGCRASRGVSAFRARLASCAAAVPEPFSAARRRLEHRERRPGDSRRGRSNSTRCRATGKSSISRRPTTAGSSTPSASRDTSCRRATTMRCRTGARGGTGRCGWSARRSSAGRLDTCGSRRDDSRPQRRQPRPISFKNAC